MLLSREIKSWKGLSEEKTLAFQPEETAPEDRRKHSGPLRGLRQFGAKRRRNRGRPCWWVAEMTRPSGDGKGTALHLQLRGGHSNGSPAVFTSPGVRAPLLCDQDRHWNVGGRKQLDSPTGRKVVSPVSTLATSKKTLGEGSLQGGQGALIAGQRLRKTCQASFGCTANSRILIHKAYVLSK